MLLAASFIEYAGYPNGPMDHYRLLVPIEGYKVPIRCTVETTSPEYAIECQDGQSRIQLDYVRGIYVRYGRSIESGVFFGTLIPVVLIFAAGFIILAGTRRA
jgi:hypothetical protein